MIFHQAQKTKEKRWQLVFPIFLLVLAAGGLCGCRMPAADQESAPLAEEQSGPNAENAVAVPLEQKTIQRATQPEVDETAKVLPSETPEAAEDNDLDATYHDPELEFSFDYPGEWERGYEERGVRGGFFTFIDPERSPAEILAQVTLYRWDPIQDLEAYQQQRRTAWESSQADILEKEDWTWGDGVPGKTFQLESLEGEIVDVYLTFIGDYYLEFTTTSEFDTLAAVVSTLR